MTSSWARRWLPWAGSLALTVILLAYLLQGIEARQILDTALAASPAPFGIFLVLLTVGAVARAARFWILAGRVVPFPLILGITFVRNLLVDLLPARLGELSYVYLLTTRARRPPEEGVATLAVAFLLDLVALSPLVLVALVVVGSDGRASVGLALLVSAMLAVGGAAAIWLAAPIVREIGRRVDRPGGSTRRRMIAARLDALAASLGQARAEGVLLPAFGLSIVVRLAKYGASYFLVLSLLMPMGYSPGELGVFRIFLGSVAAEVAASLPVHGLAGFGTYEMAWSLALERLGYPREHAVISGLVAHAITQLVEYLFGGLALVWIMRPGTGRLPPGPRAAGAGA